MNLIDPLGLAAEQLSLGEKIFNFLQGQQNVGMPGIPDLFKPSKWNQAYDNAKDFVNVYSDLAQRAWDDYQSHVQQNLPSPQTQKNVQSCHGK